MVLRMPRDESIYGVFLGERATSHHFTVGPDSFAVNVEARTGAIESDEEPPLEPEMTRQLEPIHPSLSAK
jgi:hypothetical protein